VCSLASGGEFLAKAVEPAAHARVESTRAGLDDDAAEDVGVDAARGLDPAAGGVLDPADELRRLLVGELDGRGQLELEDASLLRDQPLELRVDLLDLGDPALLGQQQEEVADELVGRRRRRAALRGRRA